MTDALEIWVVSDGPRDFPHHVVARRWLVFGNRPMRTDDRILGGDVDTVERKLPAGLTYTAPGVEDDPRVVGVYV